MARYIRADKIQATVIDENDSQEIVIDGETYLALPKNKYLGLLNSMAIGIGGSVFDREFNTEDGIVFKSSYIIREEAESSTFDASIVFEYIIQYMFGSYDDYYIVQMDVTTNLFSGNLSTLANSILLAGAATYEEYPVDEDAKSNFKKNMNLDMPKSGYFPEIVVGKADDLSGHGESVPAEFSFRASGGKSIKDGTACIKELQGNAVVWNQQLEHISMQGFGCTMTWDGDIVTINGTSERTYLGFITKGIPCVLNEKFLIIAEQVANPNNLSFSVGLFNAANGRATLGSGKTFSATIVNCISTIESGFGLDNYGGEGTDLTGIQLKVRVINLTKMFQAGNEPTTIEEYNARKPIVENENAYNEGEVIPFNADGIKSVGDNAWDEQWENGSIAVSTGQLASNNNALRNANIIRVLPNNEYHVISPRDLHVLFYDRDNNYLGWHDQANLRDFTTPQNAYYIRFYCPSTPTYNHDITISLYHSGWKAEVDNAYKPYWADTLQIDSRIKEAFPNGMMPWDKVYNKDGKGYIVKGTGKVDDMSQLNWVAGFGGFHTSNIRHNIKHLYEYIPSNMLCPRLATNRVASDDVGIALIYGGSVDYPYNGNIKVVGYDSIDSLLADLQGVPLYYELAEPTILEYDTPFQLDYKVADFGTEEIIGSEPSAPFKGRTIYQFNAVDQIRENYNEIEKIKAALAKAGITIDLV